MRAAALGTSLALALAAAPAFAVEPRSWHQEPPVSGFDFLLVLLLIPLGLALLIALLVVLPSLVQGEKYDPTRAWAGTREWFGGPSKGVDEPARPKLEGTGGTSARW